MADEDRLSRPPLKISVLEEKVFSVFGGVQRNRDFLAARGMAAFDTVTTMDRHLVELTRLHENFRMSVLPDGGIKWKVLSGRSRMGKEMVRLAALCQELHGNLVALCDSTCRRERFLRARLIAREQHGRLTSESYRKQLGRDTWVPDSRSLPKYLEDDEWFLGLAESVSKAMLGLFSSIYVMKEAFKAEFELIFATVAGRMDRLARANAPMPQEYFGYNDPARVDRQRRIFEAMSLPASEAVLVRYLDESDTFATYTDAVLEVQSELEAILRRGAMYRDFFNVDLSFPHAQLDAYVGYMTAPGRTGPGTAHLYRHLSERRWQLDAQKAYFLGRLWRMTPAQLSRARAAVAAERDGFRREETALRAGMTETIRLLKQHRRDHLEALKRHEGFDRDNDLAILKLPSEMDTTAPDAELAAALTAFRRCVNARTEEFGGLCRVLRDEVLRFRAAVEVSPLPEPTRRALLDSAGEFGNIHAPAGSLHFSDRYRATVDHYKALAGAHRALGELCVRLLLADLSARCRDFENIDRRFAGHLASLSKRAGLLTAYGGESLEELARRGGEAYRLLQKDAEEFLTSRKRILLESMKERIERTERTILLGEMFRKLDLIAGLSPRRPVNLGEELAVLERYRRELFSEDLLADAQQYWMRVRELGERVAASIRINLDLSMIDWEDGRADPGAVLDRLDARFEAVAATLAARLSEIDANLCRVPELNDLRLGTGPLPGLEGWKGDRRTLPRQRLQHLESAYAAIHSARERTSRELAEMHKTALAMRLPEEFASRLKALAQADLDESVVGFAALRPEVRAHIMTTVGDTLSGLEMPDSGKWELPAGATMRAWLSVWAEFLETVTSNARATLEEVADLREKLAGSDEANRLRRKTIGKFPLRELLRASDSSCMRDIAFLLFDADAAMETVHRDIELALKVSNLPALIDAVKRWRELRRRLGDIAARRYAPGETPLIEALRDFEDRRLREYALSRNKARFHDRALIEDIERSILRYRLRDTKMSAREFHRVVTTLQKEGQVHWKDHSDRFLLTYGEHPEYRLAVAPSGDPSESSRCTVTWGERCVRFIYDPKRMLLILKEK